MATGSIARFNTEKGWGFITPDAAGLDVMVHVKELADGEDPALLQKGVRVSYDERSGARGLRAANVRLLTAEPEPGQPDYSDVLGAAQFRDEVSTILVDAVGRLEELARSHGWVW